MATSRIKIALVLILSIIGHKCDTISDIKADLLLRGSGEEIPPEDIESSIITDIEPEKSLKDELKKDVETKDDEITSTTEVPSTITEENQDFKEELYSTLAMETTEYNNVDKIEDGLDNISNNDTVNETTLPSTATTKTAEEIEAGAGPAVVKLDEDHDLSPRVPKLSDNPEPKQQDKRNFEMKPASTPSASKSSTLKGWLQDTWLRPPAGILVPLRPMALSRALAVWNDLTVEGLNVTDIVVVGYDSNGVNWRSRHNLQPTSNSAGQKTVSEALSKLLLKYQDVNTDANSDGTMRALTSAAKLVPYDSALFVVTDKGAGDAQKLPLALRALVEKRLKVYTIWTDPAYPSEESELHLQSLRNISKHTEGGVLPYSLQVMDMEGNTELSLQKWEALESPQARRGKVHDLTEEDKFDTLLVRRGGGEAISLGVPVENGVSSLRIYIEGLVEHAVLYPPNDAPQVDLYNESSVLAFSPQSRTDGLSPRDVHLVFPGADHIEGDTLTVLPMKPAANEGPLPTVGVWHLSVRCDTCDYRLCVAARTHIHFHTQTKADSLNLRVVGPVASVRDTVLIDEYGAELATLPFNYQPQSIATDGQELPQEGPSTELIADVPLPAVKGSRVYAKIEGRDIRGEPFVRLSGPLTHQEIRLGRSAAISFPDSSNDLELAEEYNSRAYGRLEENQSSVQPFNSPSQVTNQQRTTNTLVEIGLSTRLYGAPGDVLQLHFQVTNLNERTLTYNFQAVGELRFLRGINPLSQQLTSGQIVNVIVTVGITETAQPGARDLITFTAINNIERQTASTYVYVTSSGQSLTDVWSPVLRHNFQGSCIGRQGEDCAQYIWSATVIARDQNSGLLRLTSSPTGLQVDRNFIAGSREEVTASYRATCCAPRIVVTAVDAYGNANSYIIDISNYLTGAGIAAIVLAVFLFIALVVLIGFFIYWCIRRRKASRELPYSTSTSRNLN